MLLLLFRWCLVIPFDPYNIHLSKSFCFESVWLQSSTWYFSDPDNCWHCCNACCFNEASLSNLTQAPFMWQNPLLDLFGPSPQHDIFLSCCHCCCCFNEASSSNLTQTASARQNPFFASTSTWFQPSTYCYGCSSLLIQFHPCKHVVHMSKSSFFYFLHLFDFSLQYYISKLSSSNFTHAPTTCQNLFQSVWLQPSTWYFDAVVTVVVVVVVVIVLPRPPYPIS